MACVINYNNKTYSLEDFKNILLQDPFLIKEVANKSQERLKVIQEVFNSNPELSKIGDVFSYAIYLDTIFPDSKVKDIVYHGTRFIFDKFDKSYIGISTLGGKAFYFTKDFKAAGRYAWNDMYEDGTSQGHFVMRVILNIKNPSYNSQISDINISLEQGQIENLKQKIEREIQKIGRVDTQGTFFPGSLPHSFFKVAFNKNNTAYLEEFYIDNKETVLTELENGRKRLDKKTYTRKEFLNISQGNVQKILKGELIKAEKLIKDYNEKVTNIPKSVTPSYNKENDGVIQNNDKTNEYAVFDPEQIHILSSKADIQGFKDFVNKGSNVQTLKGKLDGSKLSEIEGKLEANKDRLIELLGSSMYSEKLKDVVYKELLQNAFDATKIAESKGLISKGKIDIEINEKERIISFTDNGIGMTPEIVQKAFFTIGGTYKGEDVDNKLKSGGLGLAKMAFIFGSEKLSLETIHNGIKTTVDATSEEIRKDNFKIKTEPTNQKNGTKVSIKIPKTYVDSKGENKEIDFPAYSDSEFKYSFLANPLIGNVDINYSIINREVSYRKEEKLKTNLGDIPEGYVLFSPAKTSFADMNIYIDTKNITKGRYGDTKHSILSSGLFQFNVSFKTKEKETIPLNIIIDIKPKVDATNSQYPFNNQREDFKPTVKNDINALNAYLALLWKSIEIEILKNSFSKIKNIDAVDVNNIDNNIIEANKNITREFISSSNSEIILKAVEDFNKRNEEAFIKEGGLVTKELSLTKEDIDKEAEKAYGRTFKAEKDISVNKETGLNLDSNKPIIHNNTDMTLDEKSTRFLTEISSIMIEYKKSIIDFYGEDYSSNIKNQLWGVSIDKNYGGVNVNPSFLNMLAINPFYNFPTNPKVDAVNYIAVALDHLIIHELNHNFERNEGAGFTGRFLTTYSEIHSLPNHFELMSKLKLTIKNNLEIIKKLNYEYEQSENVESGFEGNKIEDNNQRRADIGIKSISKNDSNNNVGTTINDRGSSEKFGEIINSNLVDNSEIQYSKRESNSNTIDRLATSYSQMLEDENTDLDNGLKEKKLLEYLNKQIKYIDEEGNECAKFGLKTGVSGTNWRIEENLNWGKKHSEGGIDLTMTDDGIVFRRNNSDIKASHGLVIKAEDGIVMPDESNIDGEDPKKPPKYPKSIKIKDGRVKNPITGKPFNGNKSGDYDYLLMHEVVHNAKKYGIDPYNFLAMAMQETTLGKAGGGMSNPFHILNSSTIESKMDKKRYSEYFKNKTDRMRPVEMAANFYKNVKLLDKPKKKNPNIQDDIWDLQSWNGYGSIYPTTEQHIDGGGDRYGVSIPKEGINMSKNPMYGIWVKDLSNIFRDSKEVNDLVTRIYGPNAPAPYPDRIINDDVSE